MKCSSGHRDRQQQQAGCEGCNDGHYDQARHIAEFERPGFAEPEGADSVLMERGLEVSLCSLSQDQLVQRKIRNGLAEPLILFLQPLQFLQWVCAHSAVLFLPAVLRLFSHADLPDRIQTRHALPRQNLTCHNFVTISSGLGRLFAMVFLRFLNIAEDHFSGGGAEPVE